MSPITLLPIPRSIDMQSGNCLLEGNKRIALVGAPAQDLRFSGERLKRALREYAQVEWTLAATAAGPRGEIGAVLSVDPAMSNGPEAYVLDISDANEISIRAGSAHGIFNGVCTLVQILQQQAGGRIPALHISDYPDYANRGVLLDISRNKVPKMETLYDLVDMLASWKVNQFQLYTEHTFAYRNHPIVWKGASPLSEQEILDLDAYCRERFIDLVPNQNSFGHMHNWLKHEPYKHLAEAPEGCETPWGHFDGPYGLNPLDPRSLELVKQLYDELLPHFSSPYFNVNCDETIDLGQGRSRRACAERGEGRVYLDYVLSLYRDVKARGRTMMFWADMILGYPDLLQELPKDIITLDWGYEFDYEFASHGAALSAAGIPFYLCPGTSSWNSIIGRTSNARGNILNAAESGLKTGAIGLLNTDWGDNGHWQHLPVSYLGFAYGAGVGWCVQANRDIDLPSVLDQFAFRDRAGVMGRAAFDLGNVYQSLHPNYINATVLGRNLFHSLEQIREIPELLPEDFPCAFESIDRAASSLESAQMQRADAELILREFRHAVTLSQHSARRGMLAFETDAARASRLKQELDAELVSLMEAYRELWHARNRPGGLEESIAWMEKAREAYR